MTIQLAPEIEALIDRYLATGRYTSEADVLREAFDALDAQEQDRARLTRLRQLIQEGLDASERIPYTPTLLAELGRNANARYERGERVYSDLVE